MYGQKGNMACLICSHIYAIFQARTCATAPTMKAVIRNKVFTVNVQANDPLSQTPTLSALESHNTYSTNTSTDDIGRLTMSPSPLLCVLLNYNMSAIFYFYRNHVLLYSVLF